MPTKIFIKDLIKKCKCENVGSDALLNNEIKSVSLILPGLEFVGFYEDVDKKAGILLFDSHVKYINELGNNKANEILKNIIFKDSNFVCLCDVKEDISFIKQYCSNLNVPLIKINATGMNAINLLYSYISNYLSPTLKIHGTLVSVSGTGILLRGPSGIGKSEIALELIKRGHRLVADDSVVTYQKGISLYGRPVDHQKHLIEVRGIGIINIYRLFGLSAIKDNCEINFIINLVNYEDIKENDRIFDTVNYEEINGVRLPSIKLPVGSGRSLADIIEVSILELSSKFNEADSNDFANEFDKLVRGD